MIENKSIVRRSCSMSFASKFKVTRVNKTEGECDRTIVPTKRMKAMMQ